MIRLWRSGGIVGFDHLYTVTKSGDLKIEGRGPTGTLQLLTEENATTGSDRLALLPHQSLEPAAFRRLRRLAKESEWVPQSRLPAPYPPTDPFVYDAFHYRIEQDHPSFEEPLLAVHGTSDFDEMVNLILTPRPPARSRVIERLGALKRPPFLRSIGPANTTADEVAPAEVTQIGLLLITQDDPVEIVRHLRVPVDTELSMAPSEASWIDVHPGRDHVSLNTNDDDVLLVRAGFDLALAYSSNWAIATFQVIDAGDLVPVRVGARIAAREGLEPIFSVVSLGHSRSG